MAALFSWASINLNSRAATKKAMGTRCAEKVGFGKRVKQEKIWRGPSPRKVMDGLEEKDFFYYTKFVGRPKWCHQEFWPLTPKFSQNLDRRKL